MSGTKSASENVGEGCGCLMACIGIAIVLWALAGFPQIPALP